MWVTSVDNYQQDGVIFKGNVRNKDTSAAYAKMKQRLAVSDTGSCWAATSAAGASKAVGLWFGFSPASSVLTLLYGCAAALSATTSSFAAA
jgi:hypothetical protein